MPIDAKQLVENILRMPENVDDSALIREMIRIAQEGDVVARLVRLLHDRGVEASEARRLLHGAPEEIYLGVLNRLDHLNKGLDVAYRDSAGDLVRVLKARLKGGKRG